jgi:hypothetical protein
VSRKIKFKIAHLWEFLLSFFRKSTLLVFGNNFYISTAINDTSCKVILFQDQTICGYLKVNYRNNARLAIIRQTSSLDDFKKINLLKQ